MADKKSKNPFVGKDRLEFYSDGGNQKGIEARDGFPIFIDAVKKLILTSPH